ncbi:MAG TPA: polyprenyl synthetase family protein [Candidatus Monoglobus merdigallinarum]|uniref:Farnesyl diphosphate synthase n=1 Tax=Candidatus Monoglobus merdigallinarum TaxID=2838698 RepID=A0A9D1PQ68_9FIRM|nr:polyprenyl synthetase family protein [Candidatus Monoglobus merdigallinarum]
MSGFESKLSLYTGMINDKLEKIINIPDAPERIVYEAMRYSLLAGGKRIRPVLTAAVAEMLGGSLDDAVTAGCAVELIHTYSLIHDDLPCMDNDDLRRGKPTCHKAFPENIALLAGDGLLNMAFELLSAPGSFKTIDCGGSLALIRCLASASGVRGMIGGQVIDLESENKQDVTLDNLTGMHGKKTGALIEAAAVMGCIVSGFTDENCHEILQIRRFSANLGLAFQIKDDILDVTGDEGSLGKPVGSDEAGGKNTYVTMLGIGGADARLREKTDAAVAALNFFGDRACFLRELADALLRREN